MAKIVTDRELAEIVVKIVEQPSLLCDEIYYQAFLEDLLALLCEHAGGRPGRVSPPDDDLPTTAAVHRDCEVPPDGGAWACYDTDVSWAEGDES